MTFSSSISLPENKKGGRVLKQNKSRLIAALFLDASSHAHSSLIVLAPASQAAEKALAERFLNADMV